MQTRIVRLPSAAARKCSQVAIQINLENRIRCTLACVGNLDMRLTVAHRNLLLTPVARSTLVRVRSIGEHRQPAMCPRIMQ